MKLEKHSHYAVVLVILLFIGVIIQKMSLSEGAIFILSAAIGAGEIFLIISWIIFGMKKKPKV